MPTPKHTPGPWHNDPHWRAPVIEAGTEPPYKDIAAIFTNGRRGDMTDEDTANARLIAAAPDLLAALKALHAVHRGFSSNQDWGLLDDETRAAAEAAIAKAEGDTDA